MSKALKLMAARLSISESDLHNIVLNTVMPNSGKSTTQEEFITFIAVANEYGLNPLTKEIYAFPTKGGGIQPIVSIDGWLKIINNHPQFDGMTFEDIVSEDSKLLAVKCKIYKKDIRHPVEVVEYMNECYQPNKEPWKKWPARMLRHKSAIQCGRYAFGLSGIIEPDEAERYKDVGVIEPEPVLDVQEDIIKLEKSETMQDLMAAWADVYTRNKGKNCIKQLTNTYTLCKQNMVSKANSVTPDQMQVEQENA